MPTSSFTLWKSAKLAVWLSLLAYTYSYGYLFRIEPEFIPAFSPLDLILWATTALWLLIGVAMVLSVVILPFVQLLNMSARISSESRYRWAKRLVGYEPYVNIALMVGPFLAIAAVMGALERFGPRQPLMARLYVFLTPLLLALLFTYLRRGSIWRVSPTFWRRWGAVLLLILVFLIGDLRAFRIRNFPANQDALFCPDNTQAACGPLIFLGSESVISQREDFFILEQRQDHQQIRSAGVPDYLPANLGPGSASSNEMAPGPAGATNQSSE